MTSRSLLAALAASTVLIGCGGSPTQPQPPATQPPVAEPAPPPPSPPAPAPVPRIGRLRFLAFGDSLTTGVIHTFEWQFLITPGGSYSYPYKLQSALQGRYTDQQPIVMNAGKPGERATDALPRLVSVLDEANADVVLLWHGANDLNGDGEEGVPAAVDGLKALIREVKRRGLTVLVATQPPQRAGGSRAGGASAVPIFNRDLLRTTAAENVPVVDLYSQFNVMLQGPDGLHPSEAGYARIAEIFFEALKSRFES